MDLFSQFFQENQKKFLSFAYSYTRNKAAAEDILMEAMVSLWENREKWEKDSNLHANAQDGFIRGHWHGI